jgi:type IV secretory pathway VirD2 relaxase
LAGRGARFAYTPARFLQRSVVKVSYTRNTQKRGWYEHGRYLARAGAQRQHERGVGFDAESNEIHLEQRLSGWEREKDPRLWKVIVSPEHGHELDLRSHARQFVDRVERDLGRRLEWVAIDHQDTWHPHVHVLIRGVDQEGRAFLIPREYVRSGMRRRSQELATRELGLRREHELSRELQVRPEQEREIKRERTRSRPHSRAERLLPPRERGGGLERDRVLERPRRTSR